MFSVIMPLYNKAPYVRRAVESVVEQSFADWELIVVDDGSTDGGAEVVEAFADPRIHLHRQANAGVGAARNRGVALSGSTATPAVYLCFLDADDWWEPTFLYEVAALIARHPGAGIYCTAYYIVKNQHKRQAPIGVDAHFEEGEIDYCQVYARTVCMPVWTGAACMPRAVFDAMGGFPEGITLGEDFLLWVKTALQYPVVLLNRPLGNYNQDADPAYRGTGRLHPPSSNMMWHLDDLAHVEATNPHYKQLVDRLRTYNLLSYLLDERYRQAARAQLAKVDWSSQNPATRRLYAMPVWVLRIRQYLLRAGSRLKQKLWSR